MGNCSGILERELEPSSDHPHGDSPRQQYKNSPNEKRRGSGDIHGKGGGHGHGHGHGKH